jgi:uncharacterized protein YecE (DUF72 family)
VEIRAGTSGFSYDEWHGGFYPRDLPAAERLTFYGSRLATVEVNNTFYQMPRPMLLERWRDAVPDGFCFALKAPRRITHVLRLKDAEEPVTRFIEVAGTLGERLGPLLFQLPPFARKDAGLLASFLAGLPADLKPAFEFRHPSWFDDEIYALLGERNAALCGGDAEEAERSPPLVRTAPFGYLRLRAPEYDASRIESWCEEISKVGWDACYVYFKHEVDGPAYAEFLTALAAGRPAPELPAPRTRRSAPPPEQRARKSRAKKKG